MIQAAGDRRARRRLLASRSPFLSERPPGEGRQRRRQGWIAAARRNSPSCAVAGSAYGRPFCSAIPYDTDVIDAPTGTSQRPAHDIGPGRRTQSVSSDETSTVYSIQVSGTTSSAFPNERHAESPATHRDDAAGAASAVIRPSQTSHPDPTSRNRSSPVSRRSRLGRWRAEALGGGPGTRHHGRVSAGEHCDCQQRARQPDDRDEWGGDQ